MCRLLESVKEINTDALQHPGSNQSAHNIIVHLPSVLPIKKYTTQDGSIVNLGFTKLMDMDFDAAGRYINDEGLANVLHLFHKVPVLMAKRDSYTNVVRPPKPAVVPVASTDGPAPHLDLRDRDITLCCISDVKLDESIRSLRHCLKQASFTKVKFCTSKSLDCPEAEVVPIGPLNSWEAYSRVVHELHKHIHTKYVLICQYDGFIVNTRSWDDSFLDYDYLGAPCWWSAAGNKPLVGNGGFSLRSRKLLQIVSDNANLFADEAHYHPEDKQIVLYKGPFLRTQGVKFAPFEAGARFAWMRWRDEAVCDYTGAFGMHVGVRKLEYLDFLDGKADAGHTLDKPAYPKPEQRQCKAAMFRQRHLYVPVVRI
jgi:hypothetical protein